MCGPPRVIWKDASTPPVFPKIKLGRFCRFWNSKSAKIQVFTKLESFWYSIKLKNVQKTCVFSNFQYFWIKSTQLFVSPLCFRKSFFSKHVFASNNSHFKHKKSSKSCKKGRFVGVFSLFVFFQEKSKKLSRWSIPSQI